MLNSQKFALTVSKINLVRFDFLVIIKKYIIMISNLKIKKG